MKVALPETIESLLDSMVAFAVAPAALDAFEPADDEDDDEDEEEDEAQPASASAVAAARVKKGMVFRFILSSFMNRDERISIGVSVSNMKPISVPPVEVSRMTLVVLVAAGAIVSIAVSGDLSRFAGGFAVGAGVPLLISKVRRPPGPDEPPPAEEETP